jgi:hypothetical protein
VAGERGPLVSGCSAAAGRRGRTDAPEQSAVVQRFLRFVPLTDQEAGILDGRVR